MLKYFPVSRIVQLITYVNLLNLNFTANIIMYYVLYINFVFVNCSKVNVMIIHPNNLQYFPLL